MNEMFVRAVPPGGVSYVIVVPSLQRGVGLETH